MADFDPDGEDQAPDLDAGPSQRMSSWPLRLKSLDARYEDQVRHVLRCFVFETRTFGADARLLEQTIEFDGLAGFHRLQASEYGRRL